MWRVCNLAPLLLLVSLAWIAQTTEADFRIAGYLPDYRLGSSFDLNASAALLDDVYLFSLFPQTQLGVNMFKACCLQNKHFEAARQAVELTEGRLRAWVTVGGAKRSHKFTEAPSDMVTALRNLLTEHPYIQGIDFDCETFLHHDDYYRYEKLVTNAATIIHTHVPGVQVSIALHPGQKMPKSLYAAVDRVNVMTYDMHGATYHADYRQMVNAIEDLIDKQECPPSKIFVGLPAYAKHKTGDVKTYHELVTETDAAGGDNFQRRHEFNGYVVDSPAAVKAKIRWALKKGIGGAFFWELGQDYVGPEGGAGVLLKAAAEQVGKEIPVATSSCTGEDSTDESCQKADDTSKEPESDGDAKEPKSEEAPADAKEDKAHDEL